MKGRSPVPHRLKAARERAQLSQKQLGILAGIDEFTASARMNQYERGKHTPSYVLLDRVAHALQLPVAYFYCAEDELAEWIMAFSRIPAKARKHVLAQIR